MKATLEFNLPEDQCAHILAIHAADWALAVQDIDERLRTWQKYGHKFKDPDTMLEELRLDFYAILADRGVDLDMIE